MEKKIPQRQCVGCREMKAKKDLIRIIKTPEDEVLFDESGKKNGRGAYICQNSTCFERARRQKGLERSLKISIPESVYDRLEQEMRAFDTKR